MHRCDQLCIGSCLWCFSLQALLSSTWPDSEAWVSRKGEGLSLKGSVGRRAKRETIPAGERLCSKTAAYRRCSSDGVWTKESEM
jgi:hypothetical protein